MYVQSMCKTNKVCAKHRCAIKNNIKTWWERVFSQ